MKLALHLPPPCISNQVLSELQEVQIDDDVTSYEGHDTECAFVWAHMSMVKGSVVSNVDIPSMHLVGKLM